MEDSSGDRATLAVPCAPGAAAGQGGTSSAVVSPKFLMAGGFAAAAGFSADFSVAQPITTNRVNRTSVRVLGMTPSRRTSRPRDCLPDTAGGNGCGRSTPATPLRPARSECPAQSPDHGLLAEESDLDERLEVGRQR